MDNLDVEGLTDVQQCYDLYAPGGKVISGERLAFLLRSLNLKPTMDESKKYFDMYRKPDGILELSDFVKIVQSHSRLEDPQTEILEAFQMMDIRNTGKVEVRDLRRILTKTGEKLTDHEVDEMLTAGKVSKDGKISYEDFIRNLLRSMSY